MHINSDSTYSLQLAHSLQCIRLTNMLGPEAAPAASGGPRAEASRPAKAESKPWVKDEFNPNNQKSGIEQNAKGFFDRNQAKKPPDYPDIEKNECRLNILRSDGCNDPDCQFVHSNGKSSKEQRKTYNRILTDFKTWHKSRSTKSDDKGKGKDMGGKGGKWQDEGRGRGRDEWRRTCDEWHRSDCCDDRRDDRRNDHRDDRRDDRRDGQDRYDRDTNMQNDRFSAAIGKRGEWREKRCSPRTAFAHTTSTNLYTFVWPSKEPIHRGVQHD
jgi:hypothetical protein